MIFLKEIAEDFLSLFFPAVCLSCGDSLVRGEEMLCTRCMVEINRTGFHLKHDNSVEQLFWGRCQIERGAAFSVYNRGSRIRKLIHLMKYRGHKEIGFALGKLYGSYLHGTPFMEGVDMLVAVPLHPDRLKKRGYNQSDYIARGLSAATGVPVGEGVLYRVSATNTQTRRGRFERWENVEGLFALSDEKQLSGKHFMIVDDVITTGSTLEACAEALHRCSNVKVSVVTLAVSQKLTI
jgi:ComF family protein